MEVLNGGGPQDVIDVTVALAREMLTLVGREEVDPEEKLRDGSAYAKWRDMLIAQGGDPDAPLPVAQHTDVVTAPRSGVLQVLDARAVGIAAWRLGAGRSRKEDPVSPTAGLMCLAKPGDRVQAGQPIIELHADDPARFPRAHDAIAGNAMVIGDGQPQRLLPLVIERIGPLQSDWSEGTN